MGSGITMDLLSLTGVIGTIVGATWFLSAKMAQISERLAVLELQMRTLWAPVERKKIGLSKR
jgi:SNF family Na+-dependent transporter